MDAPEPPLRMGSKLEMEGQPHILSRGEDAEVVRKALKKILFSAVIVPVSTVDRTVDVPGVKPQLQEPQEAAEHVVVLFKGLEIDFYLRAAPRFFEQIKLYNF